MEDREIAIRVENVSKDFKLPHQRANSVKSLLTGFSAKAQSTERQHALKDISFEIRKGEFFGIVGRNGSGKSTLLKLLAGIYQPTQGNISVRGKLVPFIELGVGFNPELTGRENVYLNGAMLGFSEPEIDSMYDDIVSFAELERFMDQKLKNYSSGMQVRLAFSMATRADADILLIDEVLAVGDADFQRKCFDYFKSLKKDKRTVVFISHDMDAVREYCDRAMMIEANEVVLLGSTEDVASSYTKLFTRTTSEVSRDSGWRTGTQVVTTVALRVEINTEHITIHQHLEAREELLNPIIGLRIRDASGKDITGTNTKIEKIKQVKISPEKGIEVEWTIPNVLGDGTYSVDPAILYSDGITVADWWNDAIFFDIKKERHVPYVVDPGFKVKIK